MSSALRAAACAFVLAVSACEPRVTQIGLEDAGLGAYLEAESGALSGGFQIASDAAASAGYYITAQTGATSDDAPGPARASYDLDAEVDGTYLIWGRIHTQTIYENRFYFQVDDGAWIKWRITTGDVWYWDGLHDDTQYGIPVPFPLTRGTHRLTIANDTDGAALDRLYFAPDRVKPAGSETMCNPPHSVELAGVCNPSCGVLAGKCGETPCATVIPTYDCAACCVADQ